MYVAELGSLAYFCSGMLTARLAGRLSDELLLWRVLEDYAGSGVLQMGSWLEGVRKGSGVLKNM